MTNKQLRALHHPQAKPETFAAARRYFQKGQPPEAKNDAYIKRVTFVASAHEAGQGDFAVLLLQERDRFPDHL